MYAALDLQVCLAPLRALLAEELTWTASEHTTDCANVRAATVSSSVQPGNHAQQSSLLVPQLNSVALDAYALPVQLTPCHGVWAMGMLAMAGVAGSAMRLLPADAASTKRGLLGANSILLSSPLDAIR